MKSKQFEEVWLGFGDDSCFTNFKNILKFEEGKAYCIFCKRHASRSNRNNKFVAGWPGDPKAGFAKLTSKFCDHLRSNCHQDSKKKT